MSDKTHIEWTDATWNPITGCSVISKGCTNCYAMQLAGTRLKHHESRKGLDKRASFLSEQFKGKYIIEYDDLLCDRPRFRVIWNNLEPKPTPFFQTPLKQGEVWWGDEFQIGSDEDCPACGGTGVNHYRPSNQCWLCGHKDQRGKGSGTKK